LLIDRLVHGCYANVADFDRLVAYAMLYFVAATFSEHRRRSGACGLNDGFLLSHDAGFTQLVERSHAAFTHGASEKMDTSELHRALDGWNVAGLCDVRKRNMYPFA
jgi:hypothetical protein